jgi:phosphomannomutase
MNKERHYLKHFGDAGTGGLKILFFPSDIKSYVIINNDADSYIKDHDIEGKAIAAIWMRGSATEPVFRIMADTAGTDKEFERFLLNWQHRMIMKAYLNSIPRQL